MQENQCISVTVGIPAYNESKNIARLIRSVLIQTGERFLLQEVVIISDGSNDDTVAQARTVNDSRLRVIGSHERKGKAGRCNELFDLCKTDVLVQFDADMRLPNDQVIAEMVRVMQAGNYGFVCANLVPVQPITFAEKLAYFGIATWTDILDELGPDKTMLHHCVGGARLFTRQTLQNFRFPALVEAGEDVYTYFTLLKQGTRIGYAPLAVVQYKLAATFTDYLKQMHRFLTTTNVMSKEFGQALYEQENPITTWVKLRAFARRLFRTSPVISIGYACLQLYARLTVWKYRRTKLWEVAVSTK